MPARLSQKIRSAIRSRVRPKLCLGGFCSGGCGEQKLRAASETCMAVAGGALVGSVLIWAGGRAVGVATRGGAERLGIFVGLWVPSLMLLSAYLTRKADDASAAARDDESFLEELM